MAAPELLTLHLAYLSTTLAIACFAPDSSHVEYVRAESRADSARFPPSQRSSVWTEGRYGAMGALTLNTSVRMPCSTAAVRPRAVHFVIRIAASSASDSPERQSGIGNGCPG